MPLKPMLASITEGVPDALKQLGVEEGLPFLAEYKYDGIRAQVCPSCSARLRLQHPQMRLMTAHGFSMQLSGLGVLGFQWSMPVCRYIC